MEILTGQISELEADDVNCIAYQARKFKAPSMINTVAFIVQPKSPTCISLNNRTCYISDQCAHKAPTW